MVVFLSSAQNPFSTSLMSWNLSPKSLNIWIQDSAARDILISGSLKEELRAILSASALSVCSKIMTTPPRLVLLSMPTQNPEEEMHVLRFLWPGLTDIWLSISCRNLFCLQSQIKVLKKHIFLCSLRLLKSRQSLDSFCSLCLLKN